MAETSVDQMKWQQTLSHQQEEQAKEWMCLQRRYKAEVLQDQDPTENGSKHLLVRLNLSDPDLPHAFKTESLELHLHLPATYPIESPTIQVDQESGCARFLTEEQRQRFQNTANKRACELCGSCCLRKLLTWVDNHFVRVVDLTIDNEVSATDNPGAVQVETKDKVKKKSTKLCHFYARGKCTNGENCRYVHDDQKKKQTTKNKKSKSSFKQHDTSSDVRKAEVTDNGDTEPVKSKEANADKQQQTAEEEEETTTTPARFCKFYARNRCKNGDRCKFSHQRPKTTAKMFANATTSDTTVKNPEVIDLSAATAKKPAKATDGSEWTEEQQRALDVALKKYPPTMDKRERWTCIANDVDGKTLNDCIDRFKYLVQLVKRLDIKPDASNSTIVHKYPEDEEQERLEPASIALHDRIIPLDKRIAIEVDPALYGTQIRLDDLFLHEIGTVVPHRLVCQMQCQNCPLTFDAKLSLDASTSSVQKWCPRCSIKHTVSLRPVFAHLQSNIVAYIDADNCMVADVLPSDFLGTCLECNQEALFEAVVPAKRAERTCFACHHKLALMLKRYAVGHVATGIEASTKPTGATAKTKKTPQKRITENFVLGQPLPRKGACDHYKNSFRWFRFQCCGKAFPCDVCHDQSDCAEANLGKIASRMICGLCSKEQPSANKVCSCGNEVGRKTIKSNHWEGGAGCRNPAMMAHNDKQKYRGINKTESQKFKRVGLEAKVRLEHVNRSRKNADES